MEERCSHNLSDLEVRFDLSEHLGDNAQALKRGRLTLGRAEQESWRVAPPQDHVASGCFLCDRLRVPQEVGEGHFRRRHRLMISELVQKL